MSNVTDLGLAHAVIELCQQKSIYKGAMPGTDEEKLAVATKLANGAENAVKAGVVGDAPKLVADMVANFGQPAAAAAPVEDNPFGSPPVAAPTPVAVPPTAPTPDPVPAAPAPAPVATASINDLFGQDYEEMGWKDVLAAMETMTPEQIAAVKMHEQTEGKRAKILTFEPTGVSTPPPAAEPAVSSDPDALPQFNVAVDDAARANTEPWVGYDKAKIPEIMKVVETVFRKVENPRAVLGHVWIYEKSGKDRASLIKKLTEIGKNGVQTAPPTAPPVTAAEGTDVNPEAAFAQAAEVPAATPATPTPVEEDPFAAAAVAATPAPAQPTSTGTGISQPLQGATQAVDAIVAQEGLPVPNELRGEAPDLPENFVEVGISELGTLSSKFNACQARANYLADVANGHSYDARVVADDLVRRYLASTDAPKGTTVSALEAKASESPDVQNARRVQHEYAAVARRWKVLADIYGNNIERLSRELTRRQLEAGK